MRIAIFGLGFVGNALLKSLNSDVEVIKVDPKINKSVKDIEDKNCEIIFVCVPTPMSKKGSQDLTILEKLLKEISDFSPESLVVIKSTVLPDKIENLSSIFKDFIYNPEFLRERHAYHDLINAEFIIIGGNEKNAKTLSNFYKNHTHCKTTNFNYTDLKTASILKYAVNSFLATKVIFFNELKNVFDLSNTKSSWDEFIELISQDKRIGSTHMNVPGPDGRLGYGGACFPKDMVAIKRYAKKLDLDLDIISKVIKVNNEIRSSYSNLSEREKEQKINFNLNS